MSSSFDANHFPGHKSGTRNQVRKVQLVELPIYIVKQVQVGDGEIFLLTPVHDRVQPKAEQRSPAGCGASHLDVRPRLRDYEWGARCALDRCGDKMRTASRIRVRGRMRNQFSPVSLFAFASVSVLHACLVLFSLGSLCSSITWPFLVVPCSCRWASQAGWVVGGKFARK